MQRSTFSDGDEHLSQLVDHWLVTNPSVFRSQLSHSVWQEKLQQVDYPAGTFTYLKAVEALTVSSIQKHSTVPFIGSQYLPLQS